MVGQHRQGPIGPLRGQRRAWVGGGGAVGLPQNSASKRQPWLLSLLKLRMRLLFLIGYLGNGPGPNLVPSTPEHWLSKGAAASRGQVSWILVPQRSFVLPCLAP